VRIPFRRRLSRRSLSRRRVAALGLTTFGITTLMASGCTTSDPAASRSAARATSSVSTSVIADRLEVPWGIAFLPDGSALVTERDRRDILRLTPGTNGGRWNVTKVQTVDEAVAAGEGGLLGIAVSPTYARDRLVFVYYSTENDNRIGRFRLGERPQPIVTGIPHSQIHNGGRLGFGPDGFLYASTGDGNERPRAQDRNSLAGKILRMNTDGTPAAGNPFGTIVYSYGHRNVQGFGWTADGTMYASEFGQNRFDELNRIQPGRNYGWPEVEGVGNRPEFTNPLVTWPTSEASCSGIAVRGSQIVIACLRGERLYTADVAANGTIEGTPRASLAGAYGRLRTVVVAPDGSIWVTTSNKDGRGDPGPRDDQILRLS